MPGSNWQGFTKGEKWPPSNKAVMESIIAATRARTNVDRDGSKTSPRSTKRGGVYAVEEGLHVSRSQAYRLIKLAREQGYIEEQS